MSTDSKTCTYPHCNCPFDAPADPNWCARGLPHANETTAAEIGKENFLELHLGRELFIFDGFNHWCDTAQNKFKEAGVSSSNVLCVDAKGRVCAWGNHFMNAAKDGAYPIRAYLLRDDMIVTPDSGSTQAPSEMIKVRKPR